MDTAFGTTEGVTVGEALSIHDAQDIMLEDQQLLDKTIAELKNKVALTFLDLLKSDQGKELCQDRLPER
ncbi:MAG: hypothetical protein HQ561_11515 [Desulfobacteraceae bacterium]|nr:hypothetical protein [Desulfobacteraceae bacterium]